MLVILFLVIRVYFHDSNEDQVININFIPNKIQIIML